MKDPTHPSPNNNQKSTTMMINKQPRHNWQQARIPKIRPAANPDWYKRFRQLAKLSGNIFRLK